MSGNGRPPSESGVHARPLVGGTAGSSEIEATRDIEGSGIGDGFALFWFSTEGLLARADTLASGHAQELGVSLSVRS